MITFDVESSIHSNRYLAEIVYMGLTFHSVEQAYQWSKAVIFGDVDSVEEILESEDPVKCKDIGKRIKGFDRCKWDEIRLVVMKELIRLKYLQNPSLWRYLKRTTRSRFAVAKGGKFWGTGIDKSNFLIHSPSHWKGANALGNLITEVRDELLKEVA